MLDRRRTGVLAGLAVGIALALSSPAGAHSSLVRAQPPPGARLAAPPAEIRLWFSEPVEIRYAGVQVLDGDGRPVTAGRPRSLPGEPTALSVPAGITEPGAYTVAWRALSRVEGHTTRGTFAFVVGTEAEGPGPAPAAPAGTVSGAGGAGTSEGWLRAFVLLLAAWVVGGALFERVVMGDAVVPRRLMVEPAGVLLIATAAQSLLWGLDAAGGVSGLPELAATRLGLLLLLRDLAALGIVVAAVWRPRARLWAGLAYLATVSLASHAAAAGDALAPVIDFVHQLAAAAWAGGLGHLAWFAWRRPEPLPWPAAVRRFSYLALVSVALLGATGLYRAWQVVGGWSALLGTGFGRLLGVKSALVAVALLLGARQLLRWRAVLGASPPRLGPQSQAPPERPAAGAPRKVLALEVLALAGVLAVTGLITARTPARQEPATHALRLADRAQGWRYSVELRPGWTGANDLRVGVRPPQPGLAAETAEIALGIEPHPGHRVWVVERPLARTAPLEFATAIEELTVPWHRWIAEVRVRASDGSQPVGSVRFALREPVDVLTPGPPVPPALALAGLLVVPAAAVALLAGGRLRQRWSGLSKSNRQPASHSER
jgi:putative copper export protein/methionine-rich copper-binding protein CopC